MRLHPRLEFTMAVAVLLAWWAVELLLLAAWALAWCWFLFAVVVARVLPPPWVKRWLRASR